TLALLRERWAYASATNKWKKDVHGINPLEREFNKLIIKISDLAHPMTKKIAGKRFIDCELIGPATFYAVNGSMTNVGFIDCDIVVLHPTAHLANVIVLEDVEVISGKIYNCTIYIPQGDIPTFKKMG